MQNTLTIAETAPTELSELREQLPPAMGEGGDLALVGSVSAKVSSSVERQGSHIDSLLAIFDQGIVSGTAFLTAAIIGRATSTDQLGMFYLVLPAILMITGIQEQVAIAPYFVYSKRERGNRLAEYSGSFWVHQFVLIAGAVVLLLGAIGILSATGSSEYVVCAWALLCAAPLWMLRNGVRRFGLANFRISHVIALDSLVALTQLAGLVLLAHFETLSLVNIFAVMGGANGLACLGWYLLDSPKVRFNRGRFKSDWDKNWSFGKWALRSYLVGDITPFITVWVLGALAGTAATGVFGGCATIVNMGNVVLIGISNILTAQASHAFVEGGAQGLTRVLQKALGILILTLGAVCLVVLATGDLLPTMVFDSDFQGTGSILLLLSVGMLINSVNTVAGIGLWSLDRPKFNLIADVCAFSLTVLSAFLLIEPWGALGAATAMLVGSLTAAVVRAMIFRNRLSKVPHETSLSALRAIC